MQRRPHARKPSHQPREFPIRKRGRRRRARPRVAGRAGPQLVGTRRRARSRTLAHRGGRLRPLPRMGRGPRHRTLAAPGRGPVRPGGRQQRHPGHAHRIGQIASRHRHDVHGHGDRPARLLHRPHQGAGFREVLLPGRHLWTRQRRYDHRRLAHQHAGPHHLLHGGDPSQPGAARG